VELGAYVSVALRDGAVPGRAAALSKKADYREGDVRNYAQINRLVAAVAPDIILHLAAAGVNDPFIPLQTALRVNLHGTLHLLQAVRQSGTSRVRRVVVAGTCHEYGGLGTGDAPPQARANVDGLHRLDPGSVYAASKVAAWAFSRMYHRAYGTPVVVARPFNVYGPGQNERALIPSAIQAALSGQDFPTTPGRQRRDFIYINDVLEGFLAVATADGIDGESLDLGTGRATSVRDVVERIFALTKSTGRPQIGALPYRPGVVWELVANANRTEQLTGWRAKTGLDEGLRSTIEAMTAA
jgi:nucleoside-diphosphate-sugar epimerase